MSYVTDRYRAILDQNPAVGSQAAATLALAEVMHEGNQDAARRSDTWAGIVRITSEVFKEWVEAICDSIEARKK